MPCEKKELFTGTFCHLNTNRRAIGDIKVTGGQQERAANTT